MTEAERIRRRSFIGASEVAAVLSVGDYACARKVYYEKTAEVPDFSWNDSQSAKRGKDLEGFVAHLFSERTGLKVARAKTVQMEELPFIASSPDRYVHLPDGTQGTLQIKVVGIWSWKKILENGIHDEYVLQVQQELLTTGLKKGYFAVFCADVLAGQGWELMFWEFSEDLKMQEILKEKLTDFWKMNVKKKIIPNQLPQPALPCQHCEFRITCLGQLVPEPMPKKPRKKKEKKDESVTDDAE